MKGRLLIIVLVGATVAACQFDRSGSWLAGDDAPPDADPAGAVDASDDTPDAAPSPPDASMATPDDVRCGTATCAGDDVCCVDWDPFDDGPTCMAAADCDGGEMTCDEPDDCGGGEHCCAYGGFGSSCNGTCVGGDRVCVGDADCTAIGAGSCCPGSDGLKVCRLFCL